MLVKKSRHIRLVLLGTLSAGLVGGCDSNSPKSASISADNLYTNNYYVPGAGYYHAPFRGWFAQPYNSYDAQARTYFQGGQWLPVPHQSITNISSPTQLASQQAQSQRTDIARHGFGRTGSYHYIHS